MQTRERRDPDVLFLESSESNSTLLSSSSHYDDEEVDVAGVLISHPQPEAYQADLRKVLKEGKGLSPVAVEELHHTTDLALCESRPSSRPLLPLVLQW